ncbi:hypothetical protein AHAS_Ahas03G0266800 [Arachis hypogaea]
MSIDRKDIMTYDIYVQMVDVYNEQVRDLLVEDKTNNKLEIRSCNDDGLSLPDAILRPVTSTSDVLTLMKLGEDRKRLEQLYSKPFLRLVYDCILMDAEMGIGCCF